MSARLTTRRGDTVCFVGEWCGDTGDPAFLHQLQTHFTLLERRPLPNWSDTSHELTIWQRHFEAGGMKEETHHHPATSWHFSTQALAIRCSLQLCSIAAAS